MGAALGRAALSADEHGGLIEPGLAGRENRLRGRYVAVVHTRHLLANIVHRRSQFVTQAQVQGHARADTEIVLNVTGINPLAAVDAARPDGAVTYRRQGRKKLASASPVPSLLAVRVVKPFVNW